MVTDLMMPAAAPALSRQRLEVLPSPAAPNQIPASTPASRRPSKAIPVQASSTGTEGKENVDWARFTATVQGAAKKNEQT